MSSAELDAAERVRDPSHLRPAAPAPPLAGWLHTGYASARRVNARHGRSYFLATRLLPRDARDGVHALYAFARTADDIVDDGTSRQPAHALDELTTRLHAALAGSPDSATLAALADTVHRYRIEPTLFTEFLAAMRMDLHVSEYPDFTALDEYMHGSACSIGKQLLPILGTVGPRAEAVPYAEALGKAFQLTNFLRDIGEDLDRGRLYLPRHELAAFGVDRELLYWARRTGRRDARIRRALAHLVAHNRAVYRRAEPGIELLRPSARACVATAFALYQAILDEIESADYDVLDRRAVVPPTKRFAIVLPGLAGARRIRVPRPVPGA